ncbi:hypothetical protein ASG31_17200 [Chryseobacterium sp. Leaf404]|uniref:hypothetical protein n=1 Tax=unclassified Chryseobacterium TaxID=2593645 RepID=UPI0006F77E96|nr:MULTISPECIES: hypothetical protein [unclassified Chryseobacterium]KQT20505.1 hypothetical protein ASG31_17200 [Chryseobacterium sp. Leaf404]
MKTPEKIAIGIAAAIVVGGLTALGFRKKRASAPKTFTAPDGNIYPENHVYRTFDNQYFKNGKKIKYQTPAQSIQDTHGHFDPAKNKSEFNHHAPNPSVDYHQRGVRHR